MAADEEYLDRLRSKKSAVYKCGYLAVSSKGLGWKTWKRRWFLLTRTSLLYFKAEPKGSINGALALGGIDLNSSGSISAKADKKQVTLSYPDGRAFTLRAEDQEDYEEWKFCLEKALAAAPSSVFVGQSLFFGQDLFDPGAGDGDTNAPQSRPLRSLVIGRPILLALEDIDGSPSFLEKAIRYIELHGVRAEGILRESADVADVERRILEYEQGEKEFTELENPHVIGDCIKHVLREMPSPIVPFSCCTALEECMGLEESSKVDAVKMVLEESFPEPNRRLLQRILRMMLTCVDFEALNRMNRKAVATCMGPLILRPLMGMDSAAPNDHLDQGGRRLVGGGLDEGAQILAAARSAARVQTVIVFLMDHFNQLFPTKALGSLVRSMSLLSYGSIPSVKGSPEPGSPPAMDRMGNEGDAGSRQEEENIGKLARTVDSFGSFSFQEDGPQKRSPERALGKHSLPQSASMGSSVTESRSPGHRRNFSLPEDSPTFPNSHGSVDIRGSRSRTDLHIDTNSEPLLADEEAQLRVLELTRQDLRTSLSREVRATASLRESLYTKKSNLITKRVSLQKEAAALRLQLEAQKEMLSEGEKSPSLQSHPNSGRSSPVPQLDARVLAELEEIGGVERDIVRLKSELSQLRRQLAYMQHRQQSPVGVVSSNQGSSAAERKQKVQALLELKSQLHRELERTMVLCLEEQQKNNELESKQRDSPSSLEQSVLQQRSSLADAQATLQAELQRGKELRKMMKQAQKAKAVLDEGPLSAEGTKAGAGSESAPGRDRTVPHSLPKDKADKSLKEISLKLEQFRERRTALMQQLTQLSVETTSRNSSQVTTPRDEAI